MSKIIRGRCLCGKVEYEIENKYDQFYICHCEQYRRTTGLAFAANVFGRPEKFNFTAGAKGVKRFDHNERGFTKAFCMECGSGGPYLNSTGKAIVVPAGTLDAEPEFNAKNVIFHSEKTCWSAKNEGDSYFDGFPV